MKKFHYKKSEWARSRWDDRLFLFLTYLTLFLIAFACIYPMYFTVIASFSNPNDVYTGKVTWLPSDFTTIAYRLVFQNKNIWTGYANTVFYTFAGTLFNLFLTIPAAYALSKKQMWGHGILTFLFVFTMYFGGGMIPTYILMNKLHLIDSRWVMILAGGISVYNVIVTRTYFQNNIPESLYEAAKLDGASELRIFTKLVLPLSGPITAVIALYYAVTHWSGYFNAMIYLNDSGKHPLQLVLRKILILNESAYEDLLKLGDVSGAVMEEAKKAAEAAVSMKYALVFIASLPMLIVYPFIQKYFVRGMMIGSVKG